MTLRLLKPRLKRLAESSRFSRQLPSVITSGRALGSALWRLGATFGVLKISVATLCDFAQVREGLLFVSSGNITRVGRPAFPTQVNLYLALSFVVEPQNDQGDYTVEARVRSHAGELVSSATVALSVREGTNTRAAVASAVVPIQPIIKQPGDYLVDVSVNAEPVIALPLAAAVSSQH